MLNPWNAVSAKLLRYFSLFTLTVPLTISLTISQANANTTVEIALACDKLREYIGNLDFNSPTRIEIESKYAQMNCHNYLRDRSTARNCAKIWATLIDPNTPGAATSSIETVYRKGCVIEFE
jgi:hypothetical protein